MSQEKSLTLEGFVICVRVWSMVFTVESITEEKQPHKKAGPSPDLHGIFSVVCFHRSNLYEAGKQEKVLILNSFVYIYDTYMYRLFVTSLVTFDHFHTQLDTQIFSIPWSLDRI